MSRLAVYSEANSGGDRIYLDTVGILSGLRYSTAFPGGDATAQWQMFFDARTTHRALGSNRRITIPIGTTTGWSGYLDNPQRGNPWQFTATGRMIDAKNYQADAPTTGNALALNEVVDAAISRGVGWTRPSSLPSVTNAQNQTGSITLNDALTQVAQAVGQYWSLSRTLAVTMAALPATLSYVLMASDTAGGRTLDDYVTDVYVTYLDWQSYAPTTILRSATSRPFGRVEAVLDITNLNAIPLAQAQAAGDAYLATNSARLRFLGAFTVTPGQLLNPGGAAVDLATVQAGSVVRILLTDPDTAAGELALGAVQLVVGQTDYDVDSDTLTLTPLDVAQTGLGAYLRGAAA